MRVNARQETFGIWAMQKQVRGINQLARRLRARGLVCQGIELSYFRSTTASLGRQGLYDANSLSLLSESLSVLVAAKDIKEGSLDVKDYLRHLISTASQLKGVLVPEQRASLLIEKANQFIEIPLRTKLLERSSAMLEVFACKNEAEVASKTVAILQKYFNGAHPTFVIMEEDGEGQQFLVPLDIALGVELKRWAEEIMGKRLGQFRTPITEDSENFYVQIFIAGETYRKDNITRGRLIELGCDFLDVEMGVFLKLARIVYLPSNTYLMIPLEARGKKLGVVTFLKKDGSLTPTEQKEIENFLKLVAHTIAFMHVEEELENKVAERTAEIGRMQRQVARLALAGGMAHIGKNKMNVLLGNLGLLARGETRPNSLVIIERAVQVVNDFLRTIDKFLDYSKPIQLDKNKMSPGAAVNDAIEHINLESDIRIDREFEENLPRIGVDMVFFRTVVEEIIENAMDEFEIIAGDKEIKLQLTRTATGVRFVVWNSGSHIPKGEEKQIFEPFKTSKRSDRGNGLGLAIVSKIIDDHGWNIEAKNQGDGVAFIIDIPVRK